MLAKFHALTSFPPEPAYAAANQKIPHPTRFWPRGHAKRDGKLLSKVYRDVIGRHYPVLVQVVRLVEPSARVAR
jgi:hypothetical protein